MASNQPKASMHSRIQFNDGAIALAYNNPGDTVLLGIGSTQKWAQDFGPTSAGAALIQTKSGNSYAIMDGVIINMKNGVSRAWGFGEELKVEVGKPLEIPGIGSTTDVRGVYLRYKTAERNSSFADRQIDTPSPFPIISQRIAPISESLGLQH